MEDQGFKIVKTNGGDELIARIGNYAICKAAKRLSSLPRSYSTARRLSLMRKS
jgi:hypothetical protein